MYASAIAWEGRSLFDGAPIAVVVSNIGNVYSKNPKCGKFMAQATILRTTYTPKTRSSAARTTRFAETASTAGTLW